MSVELMAVEVWADVETGVVVEALAAGIGVEVLVDVDVNVSTVMMVALKFPMSISYLEFSC